MNGFTITTANFASMPVGVVIVWGIMKLLDMAFVMSTRAKVLVQLGVALVYAAIAALLFMNGSTKELLQQGIVLFLAVALAQVFGYETITKLAGVKGDALPFTIRRKTKDDKASVTKHVIVTQGESLRGPTPEQYMTASHIGASFIGKDDEYLPTEKVDAQEKARAPYREFSEQGREDGRI